MKLEINKERLLRSIQKAEKIASKNLTLPVLSCLLFETKNGLLKIKATNLDISIIINNKAKIEKDGVAAIPSQTISSFISNLPKSDTNINLELKDNNLLVNTKSSDTTIKTQSTEDFPEIKETSSESQTRVKSEDFINGLNSVWYSSSNSNIKPELSSVYVYKDESNLFFVATDSFRLAEKKINIKNIDNFEDVLIPFKNVTEIIRVFDGVDEDLSLDLIEDQLVLKSEEIYLSSRIVDGTFPDYKQIIPKESKTNINVLKEDFIQSLKISNIFSGKFNQVIFSILPEDKIFEIQSNSNDLGETKNVIKSKLSGDNLKISFNSKYINDCFGSIKSESISLDFSGLDKPMIIKSSNDDSFTYLVMPMNK
jgi:DNA polymerase-3 subunit beta